MLSLKLRKVVAAATVAASVLALSPIGASAEWRQDSYGWWNTEGSSYSVGWSNIDNTWYYFGTDGYMKTGWVNDGGTWYYLQSSGAMKTGWVNDGGTWYYLQSSGAMKTGWINDNGVWYFAASSGAMQTGVIQVDGKIYYLAPSGAMQKGTVTIDGKVYTFALSGEAVGSVLPTPTLAFTSAGVSAALNTTGSTGTATPISSGGSSGGGGGSSSSGSSTKDKQQKAIDNAFVRDTKISLGAPIDNNNGTVTVQANVDFAAGDPVNTTIGGVTYTGTKNVHISFDDGTDVGLEGNLSDGFKIQKGKNGTIETVITLVGSDNTVRYVTPNPVHFAY
ncbi:cell wall binding repeat-containing protein [Clostridium sp. DL-VIII]|uniref:N-acetylmuramoyl-L-alanine amidase family protein n=1 Tax=Clostridium sp. DL-VIII TaxID=641107 RepID=UPI00023AFD19|nr:N-acetylmuramoyl-L-alanine amidase family protein [Clostridium sp. DL-VIII]EHI98347.1 cell wall binding repeat-containing protein [Clostridium sp. DL-VIII]